MEALTIREILKAVNGQLLGDFKDQDAVVTHVETDSRTISKGALFLPLTGERFDGHAYINEALKGGAAGCLTQREREVYLPGKFYIKVDSTHKALRDLAVWYKARFDIPVVAITGSVGKTTTKDMVASVLSEHYQVLKTEGNFNNDIGLPMTILRMEKKHQIAVLELGMNHAGELEYLSGIAQPDIVLITNVGDSHIENFGSRDGIFKAKCEIFSHAKPGFLSILNGDDALLNTLTKDHLPGQPGEVIYCGNDENLAYHVSNLESDCRSQLTCTVDTPKGSSQLTIPALGGHMIYPTLMAVAVGQHFDMKLDEIANGVRNFAPTKMRMGILSRADGITILDDTYNANPQSMRAAIEVLNTYSGDYKIAVLGDMFELGSMAPILHTEVGKYVGSSHIDCLVAIGELARDIYQAAQEAGKQQCLYFQEKKEALPALKELVKPNTTVLVKASRGMEFEVITDYLKNITRES